MKRVIILLSLLMFIAGAATFAAAYYYLTAGDSKQDATVVVPKGMRSYDTAKELAKAGVIKYPYIFYAIELASGHTRYYKAGEYAFGAGVSPQEVSQKLASGDVVIHKVTIPEGWNMREVRAALLSDTVLTGEITRLMPEGSILPETYHYLRGDTRDEVIARMQSAMEKTLDKEWSSRAEGLPLASKQEALILASIVEKETGVPDERARVAAVFINRLKKGMRLQTDPTVVYGIEQASNDVMNRPLNLADLETATPYNTYVIAGLPPAPIANPGTGAIHAALHPLQTDELYFVATGTGGHHFATTLEEHNKNVAAYRATLANAAR